MKKFIKRCLYKLVSVLKRIYYYGQNEEYKKMFAECGENVTIGESCHFYCKNIYLGNNVSIGRGSEFISSVSKIYIGDNVMFGPNVTIRGGDHRIDIIGKYMKDISESEKLEKNDMDVIIHDDVWIGCNVTILKGVEIGRGSVVGAGSVIAKSIPPYTVHIGSHGILERKRFTDEQIERHEEILYKRNGNIKTEKNEK